jgi:hypothetical protein
LISLALEDDVFYAREQQVLAFAGDLVWEWGRVPLCPLRMLQFRGSGRVLVDWRGADVLALRLTDPRQVKVLSDRLLGWIGRVVAQGAGASGDEGGAGPVACQGEGVLLIARHGQIEGRVHERAQPGDDGRVLLIPGVLLFIDNYSPLRSFIAACSTWCRRRATRSTGTWRAAAAR